MKITDIIRQVLDIVDAADQPTQEPAAIEVAVAEPVDDLSVIQQLAGLPCEPEYANSPDEVTAPLGAAFPGGDDVHQRKNPADIRADSLSMYPDWQAKDRS